MNQNHLSDEQLLAIDIQDSLSAPTHFTDCASCRDRMAQLQQAESRIARRVKTAIERQYPPATMTFEGVMGRRRYSRRLSPTWIGMGALLALVLITFVVFPNGVLSPDSQEGQPGIVTTSTPADLRTMIANSGERGAIVYVKPGRSAEIVTTLYDDDEVALVNTPEMFADGYTWVAVRTNGGKNGWVVDFFLANSQSQPDPTFYEYTATPLPASTKNVPESSIPTRTPAPPN